MPENRLVSCLAGDHPLDALAPVDLEAGRPILRTGELIDNVYFPLDAIVSVLVDMDDGSTVEVATIGREGMVGVTALLSGEGSDCSAVVQVPGRALRLPAGRVLELAGGRSAPDRVLHRYVQCLMAQITRSAACNRVHALDRRAARWLLATHDRVARDDFALTQDLLGQMLGVARPRVSTAAATLQRAGLIRYSRGRITVADRRGLEGASCNCYRVVAAGYERLLGTG